MPRLIGAAEARALVALHVKDDEARRALDAALRELPASRTHIDDVIEFQRKFRWSHPTAPRLTHGGLTGQELSERLDLISEEYRELLEATAERSLPGAADALVDLVYVCLGMAALLGLPWQELWDDVHAANMRKELGVGPRNHAHDVVKPPGWTGPQTEAILKKAGWRSNK